MGADYQGHWGEAGVGGVQVGRGGRSGGVWTSKFLTILCLFSLSYGRLCCINDNKYVSESASLNLCATEMLTRLLRLNSFINRSFGLSQLLWLRFRRDRLQAGSAAVLGMVIVGGWYVTGHLGYRENLVTPEMTYAATNSRTLESLSFVAPTACAWNC